MKLLMVLAVAMSSALPDVRVVAWWGLDRSDRMDRPGTGREARRVPVDRGVGLALSWWCCVDARRLIEHDHERLLDAPVFEGRDAAIDDLTDEMDWSPSEPAWASPARLVSGLHPVDARAEPPEVDGLRPSVPEPRRNGQPRCVDVCPDSLTTDLIAADEARALADLRAAESRR